MKNSIRRLGGGGGGDQTPSQGFSSFLCGWSGEGYQ